MLDTHMSVIVKRLIKDANNIQHIPNSGITLDKNENYIKKQHKKDTYKMHIN